MKDSEKQPDAPTDKSWLKPTERSLDDLKADYGINKDNTLERLIEKIETGEEPDSGALKTGFPKLNRALNGGFSGLSVIGGGPGVGKTTLALQLGAQIAEKNNVPFIFFSLEMSRTRIIARLLGLYCDMSMKELFGGRIVSGPDGEQARVFEGGKMERYGQGRDLLRALADRIFIIDKNDTDAWSIETITYEVAGVEVETRGVESKIRSIMKACESDKAFVAIDHLQVFPLINYRKDADAGIVLDYRVAEERERLVTLMDRFSRIQQNLNISLLLISQFSRRARQEGPDISAFLGSSSIEYLVDVGMALIEPDRAEDNEKKYAPGPNLAKQADSELQASRQVNLAILKNRDGITGHIPLTFFPAVMRFVEA